MFRVAIAKLDQTIEIYRLQVAVPRFSYFQTRPSWLTEK